MMKEVRVKCPGCQKELVVDTRTGQVIRELDKVEDAEELFDGALDKVKEQQADVENRFERALGSQEGRQSKLDEAFDEAKKRAKERPADEKPYNPMDLD
jgi:hypothetical protein